MEKIYGNSQLFMAIGLIGFVLLCICFLIEICSDGSIIKKQYIFMITFVIFLIFGSCKTIYFTEAENKYYSTEYIESLNDNNLNYSISKRRINEDLYYQYMVKTNSGGFVANKVKASTATIYYSDCPRVEWYRKEYRWLFFYAYENFQKIYIPEGSVTDEYFIDLQ